MLTWTGFDSASYAARPSAQGHRWTFQVTNCICGLSKLAWGLDPAMRYSSLGQYVPQRGRKFVPYAERAAYAGTGRTT